MAAKKKALVEDEEGDPSVERVVPRARARTLDDLVTDLAQAHTDSVAIRKAVTPLLVAFVIARGERFMEWAFHCEWRGTTLRFVIYDSRGEEFDARLIPLRAAAGLDEAG